MTYTRTQSIIRQYGGIQERDKREEDRSQQELVDVVVPRVEPVT